jgi:cysteine-rich repeat protein
MNCKPALSLIFAAAAAAAFFACSPPFTACETCVSGGAGGEADERAGQAGSSSDSPSAGKGGSGSATKAEEATLFGACSELGRTVCSGHALAQRLACDGSKWSAGTTCAADELCDSRSGECAKVVPECAGAADGRVVCRGDEVLTCGPDLVTVSAGVTCVGLCKDGVCQKPQCGDHKLEPGEECDDGAGGSGACFKCKLARCGDGVIYAEHEQCDDANQSPGDGCSATCRVEPVALALGGATSCVLSATGRVKCWGSNESGVLGLGDTKNYGDAKSQVPSKLPVLDLGTDRIATAISVSGANSACALLDRGEVKCWGNNQFGQLGTGSTDNRGDEPGEMGDALEPIPLGSGRKAIGISAGSNYTCAVLDDGSVKCWGSGQYGQLGGDSAYDAVSPAQFVSVDLKRPAKAVSASDGVTCALLDNGSVKCWGNAMYVPLSDLADRDGSGGVGDSLGEVNALPALTFGNGKAQAIVAGHVAEALLDTGALMLWGFGYQGWTHAGVPPDDFASLSAMRMGIGRTVLASDVDAYHACAITSDGALSCWGYAYHGALGLGSVLSSVGPVVYNDSGVQTGTISVYLGGRAALRVAVGEEHTCAIVDDGTLKCWGYNARGQLGLGDRQNRGDTGAQLSADTTVDLAF